MSNAALLHAIQGSLTSNVVCLFGVWQVPVVTASPSSTITGAQMIKQAGSGIEALGAASAAYGTGTTMQFSFKMQHVEIVDGASTLVDDAYKQLLWADIQLKQAPTTATPSTIPNNTFVDPGVETGVVFQSPGGVLFLDVCMTAGVAAEAKSGCEILAYALFENF